LPVQNNNYDEQYHVLCRNEVQHIEEIGKNQETPILTVEELKKAMDVLNKGKSPDIFGITIEHLLNADEVILDFLLHIYNTMNHAQFDLGRSTFYLLLLAPRYRWNILFRCSLVDEII
jgi:hypothetical protein